MLRKLLGHVFRAAVSIVASLSSSLFIVNQSGTGDIGALQDGGVTVIRFPDGGGVALVPQAGGFQVITGLLGYDNTASGFKRLKFQHEDHPGMVPIDPRNAFINARLPVTYPAAVDQATLDDKIADQFRSVLVATIYP